MVVAKIKEEWITHVYILPAPRPPIKCVIFSLFLVLFLISFPSLNWSNIHHILKAGNSVERHETRFSSLLALWLSLPTDRHPRPASSEFVTQYPRCLRWQSCRSQAIKKRERENRWISLCACFSLFQQIPILTLPLKVWGIL